MIWLNFVLFFSFVAFVQCFQRHGLLPLINPSPLSTRLFSSKTETITTNQRPRVVLSPLPILYVYDHCPFCVRVRLALGIKNIKHQLHFLANDDIHTPTQLIGKKMVPIFQYTPKKIVMGESLDIIKLIDNDSDFGPIQQIKPFSGRKDLAQWLEGFADIGRWLQRSRYMKTVLPEFATEDSRNTFRKNHPLPSYTKEAWVALNDHERKELYDLSYEKEAKENVGKAKEALESLESLIHSNEYCTEGGFSYDDIDLWSRLRSVTLVQGLQYPSKVRNYLETLSQLADLPLYFAIAN